jgi:GTP-binding protein
MRFIDEVKIKIKAGDGGDGCLSFRREKYIPKGGPNGGDGGRGGSIYLEASTDVQTLIDFRYKPQYKGQRGGHGEGSQCNGKGGEDIVLKVPVGTIIRSDDGMISEDLCEIGQRALVAKGGKGGLGNIHFKSSTNQTPRMTTPGTPGEEREIHLELKLLSHIGLVGFPNAGKSTLLRAVSAATPKVANYPFTTLQPNLGVIPGDPPITMADIPGIIEGAHTGTGLGIRFLKHISRSACLLFVISFDKDVALHKAYTTLLEEIKNFDDSLLDRPRMIVVNKMDELENEDFSEDQRELWKAEYEAFKDTFKGTLLLSAKHQTGVKKLLDLIRLKIVEEPNTMVS